MTAMAVAAALAAKLAHDVGKYVARTARNLPPAGTAVPDALVKMLVRDLYALSGTRRASQVLDDLAAPVPAVAGDERVVRARSLLREVDELEGAVRAGEGGAIRRAAACALEVESLLRAAAAAARENGQ